MELIVAEKPKVAEKIAYALGEHVEKKSYNRVPYFEIEHDGKPIVVAPAVGHIYTLVEMEKSRGYPVFDIEWVPAYQASKEAAYTRDYVELLQKLAKTADVFVGACDFDVEGSTIAYNVFRFATTLRDGKRMKFSALTKDDLVNAYENRGEFDYNNAFAGETRHILDWYYGINLSRALMGSLRAVSRYRVLSIGRVQGPALEMLADLERQIRAFVPSPYWEITIMLKNTEFMHTGGRFLEEGAAEVALERTEDGATVQSVEKKEQIVPPQPCFDLTSLQVEAYRLFKFNPSETLELAQNLYEASIITYPRTSSQQIPASINTTKIIKDLSSDKEYKELADKLISNKWLKPLQGKKEDPAHPAIHPTGLKASVDGNQKKLYDLIVRRFLAAFAPSAKRERMRVEAKAGSEMYYASGARVVEKGWIEFYGDYFTTEDVELPAFAKNERLVAKDKKKTKKETKPPKRYTPASLVSELESRHLGTKATRSVIIDTLAKRGYAGGKSLEVTDFGIKICDILEKYAPGILDEQLTRKIEDEMEGIQEGKVNKDEVIKEGKEILIQILDKWKQNERKIGLDLLEGLKQTEQRESQVGTCPNCANQLRIIHMRDGRQFIGCYGYPNCRTTFPLPQGASVKATGKTCTACGKPTVNVKKGKLRFTMCVDPACPSKDKWKKSGESGEVKAAT